MGYKVFLPKKKELFLDVLYQTGDMITFEASLEFDFSSGISISPGLNLTWDTKNKTAFGGGLLFFYQSSKTLGKKNKVKQ